MDTGVKGETPVPARPRLANEAWGKAIEVARKYPHDSDVRELALMCASVHFGTELGLAYIGRGIDGKRAKQLMTEYESAKAWLDTTRGGTPSQ